MTSITETQRLTRQIPAVDDRRRVQPAVLLGAAVAVVVALAVILAVLLSRLGPVDGSAPVAVVETSSIGGNEQPAVVGASTDGEVQPVAPSPATSEGNDNTPQAPAPVVPAPATPAPVDPAPTATTTPVTTPSDDLSDEDEDALEEGPGGEVLDEAPSQPVPEGGDKPAEPAPPVDLDPVDPVPTNSPCADVLANGENLLVEDPVVLADGALSSEITVLNCGAEAVNWTAATKPWVALANESGNLGAGSSTELGFTIDRDAVDAGAFEFKIKVSEPGSNTYVDVSGFRATVGSDHVATDQLAAAPGSGGCANSCIRKAELVSNATSPNLTLEVVTTVPAAVNVWVSQNAPVDDDAGNASLPGVGLAAFSPGQITEWNASLTNLAPATKHYIVVEATDNNGKITVEDGSFTTVTPIELPDEFINEVPGACSQQCITQAQVHFSVGGTQAFLYTTTTHAAHMIASLSTDGVAYDAGVPTFGSVDASATSGDFVTEWAPTIGGLTPGVHYNMIMQATDEFGNSAHHVGAVHIPEDPSAGTFDLVVAPLRVTITNDADKIGRGELRFAWQAGDSVNTRGEDRMHTGDSFNFPTTSQYHFQDVAADSFVPQLIVTALERDPDGIIEFDTSGSGPFAIPDHGEIDSADLKWNTAIGGLIRVDGLENLAPCSAFGITGAWANYPCDQISTVDYGNAYPGFTAIVAYQVSADIPLPVPGN